MTLFDLRKKIQEEIKTKEKAKRGWEVLGALGWMLAEIEGEISLIESRVSQLKKQLSEADKVGDDGEIIEHCIFELRGVLGRE